MSITPPETATPVLEVPPARTRTWVRPGRKVGLSPEFQTTSADRLYDDVLACARISHADAELSSKVVGDSTYVSVNDRRGVVERREFSIYDIHKLKDADPPPTMDGVFSGMLSVADGLPEWQQAAVMDAIASLQARLNGPAPPPAGIVTDIRTFTDIPTLEACNAQPPNYLADEQMLPAQSLVGVTGPSGSGKSTLVSAIAYRAAGRGIPVLVLDRDNSAIGVQDRFKRLGIADGGLFRVFGGWCSQEVWSLDSPELLAWVATSEPKPLIVLDCLGSFYDGDENDAAHMRRFLRPARALVNMGCTVVILHNSGKGELDYRGSSAFKDCFDSCWYVSNSKQDGKLDRLTVKSYKSRYGFVGSLIYQYTINGQILLDGTAAATPPAQDHSDTMTGIISATPGITHRAFVAAACAAGSSDGQARRFLKVGERAGTLRREGKPNTGYHFFLVKETV